MSAVLDYVGIDGAENILDSRCRDTLVGPASVIDRLRVKPGRSLVAGWSTPENRGWLALLTSEDKVEGILRRAARGASDVVLHRHTTSYVLSGSIDTDPRLARPLARARKRINDAARVDVVRYNPSRRLVLRVRGNGIPGGDAMMRIAPNGLDRLLHAEQQWARSGAPVLNHTWWGHKKTAAITPYWGAGDLVTLRENNAAYACGRAIALVHRSNELKQPTIATSVLRHEAPREVAVVAVLLPELRERLDAVAARLRESVVEAGTVPIHGDLSPDQILTDGSQIRIIDLDRARLGSPNEDLGTWCASCRLLRAPELETAFLDGYATVKEIPELAPWISRALLGGALEPFRRWLPDWPREIEQRLSMAEQALGERTTQ